MRTALKWIARLLGLALIIAIAVAIWKREEITRLLAVNSLFSEEKIVDNFSNMNSAFLWAEMPRGDAPVFPLPDGAKADLPDAVQDWITARHVTSLLVLKDGKIVSEDYFLDTQPDDRRISWSVAKSYLSALFGIVVAEGQIASLDDPVTKYAPRLKDGAYDTATIRNVLQMTSGITFNEDYLDYDSDINRMGRVLALGRTMDGFAADLTETDFPAGNRWKYTSIDTHVLGMVLRGATGQPVIDLMAEKLIAPMGLEASPYYLTDGEGVAFVLGGLNLTTRDYARMGLMFAQNGKLNGTQIVPSDWVRASTAPSAPTVDGAIGYGYQWWIPVGATEGQFMARGIYGQFVYIDRPRGVVIITTAADRKFRDAGVNEQNVAIFRLISESLAP